MGLSSPVKWVDDSLSVMIILLQNDTTGTTGTVWVKYAIQSLIPERTTESFTLVQFSWLSDLLSVYSRVSDLLSLHSKPHNMALVHKRASKFVFVDE